MNIWMIPFLLLLFEQHNSFGMSITKIQRESSQNEQVKSSQVPNDVYEVLEPSGGIKVMHPKAEKPVLRDITYYHVVERPYGEEKKHEEPTEKLNFENRFECLRDPESKSFECRQFTNSHGFQFLPDPNENQESNVDKANSDENLSEETTEDEADDQLSDDESDYEDDELSKEIKADQTFDDLTYLEEDPETVTSIEETERSYDETATEETYEENDDEEAPAIDERVKEEPTKVEAVEVTTENIIKTRKDDVVEEKKYERNRLFNQVRDKYQSNKKREGTVVKKVESRRKREINGQDIPELPTLPELDYSLLPAEIRRKISTTPRPQKNPTTKRTKQAESNEFNENDFKDELEQKIEEMVAHMKPLKEEDKIEGNRDNGKRYRTYGMKLVNGRGEVWNNLWSDPGISFDVGSLETVNESEDNKNTESQEDNSSQPENISVEAITFVQRPTESKPIYTNPDDDSSDSDDDNDASDHDLEDIFISNLNKPTNRDIDEILDIDERFKEERQDGDDAPKQDRSESIVIDPLPFVKHPTESKPIYTNSDDDDDDNDANNHDLEDIFISNLNKPTNRDIDEILDIDERIKEDKLREERQEGDEVSEQSDKETVREESDIQEESPSEGTNEGKEMLAEDELEASKQQVEDTNGNIEKKLERKGHKDQSDQFFQELLNNETFWKWLGDWTATYMEVLMKHVKRMVHDEVGRQMKKLELNLKSKESEKKNEPLKVPSKKEECKNNKLEENKKDKDDAKEISKESDASKEDKGTMTDKTDVPEDRNKNNNENKEPVKDTIDVDGEKIPLTHNSNLDKQSKNDALKRRSEKDSNRVPFSNSEKEKDNPNNNRLPFISNNEKNKEKHVSVTAQNIFGNSVGSEKVTNIYIFYPTEEDLEGLTDFRNITDDDLDKLIANKEESNNKTALGKPDDKISTNSEKQDKDIKKPANKDIEVPENNKPDSTNEINKEVDIIEVNSEKEKDKMDSNKGDTNLIDTSSENPNDKIDANKQEEGRNKEDSNTIDANSEKQKDKTDSNKEDSSKEDTNIIDSNSEKEKDKIDSNKEDSNKEESNKKDSNKEDSNKDESNKKESNKEDSNKEDSSKKDSNKEDSNKDESNKEDSDKEDSNKEDSNKEDSNKEDSNKEDSNKEDSKKEDSNKEDSNKKESNKDESNTEDTDVTESKATEENKESKKEEKIVDNKVKADNAVL